MTEGADLGSSGGVSERERYGLVLTLILTCYLLAGFETNRFVVAVSGILWVTLLLTTLWAPGIPDRLRHIGVGATVVILVTTFFLGLLPPDVAAGWTLFLLALVQLTALLAILSRISRHKTVTLQSVMGGVAAYALIAFVMAAIYHGIDLLTEVPLFDGIIAPADYTYFSFVTLTTLGYGDIAPISDLAKRLVVVEAFVGQVFIVTLVARLVSLWGPPRRA